MTTSNLRRAPVLFVSHGGGPYAVLGAPHHREMVKLCQDVRWVFDNVKGVIVLTAHWETEVPHISHSPEPGVWYDYTEEASGDLPEGAWEIEYPAKGDVKLAEAVKARFVEHDLNPVLDDKRDWDHGVWVPLKMLRPEADLPVVQVSIPNARDAGTEAAFKWGAALESLRDQGYMILGSGSSYHNFDILINATLGREGEPEIPSNREFEQAMKAAATTADPAAKWAKVANWRWDFPDSEAVHPLGKSEHFLPFISCLGAAGSDVGRLLGEWTLFTSIMSFWVW
ncbi:catalytic LigB subunit of putative aromatic ring-opening dioxygenase [Diaporthe sp. PMI_573]|nr:catalytic LigB subunit of putative aromatic ring-opening dioxygenase [Diaporthaceae sp. PMI_573]